MLSKNLATGLRGEIVASIHVIVFLCRKSFNEVIKLSVCAGVSGVLLTLVVLTILTSAQPNPTPNPNPSILFF